MLYNIITGVYCIILFCLYFFILRAVIRTVNKWVKKNNKNKLWVWVAALIMYNIIFWDLVPVYALHAYKCSKEGGFIGCKTFQEWRQQNPGVAETLTPITKNNFITINNITRSQLNRRFVSTTKTTRLWYILQKKYNRIVDNKTGEVLVKYVDFYTGLSNPVLTSKTRLRDFKIWMNIKSCEQPGNKANKKEFSDYKYRIKYNGEK